MELHRALKISQKRNSFMYRLSKPAPQQIFPESYSASVLIESLRSQIFIFHGVKIFIPRRPLILHLTFTVPSSSSCVTLSNCMTALLNFTLIFQRIFTSSKTYCVRPLSVCCKKWLINKNSTKYNIILKILHGYFGLLPIQVLEYYIGRI